MQTGLEHEATVSKSVDAINCANTSKNNKICCWGFVYKIWVQTVISIL